jgi:uncharacterized membrane protein
MQAEGFPGVAPRRAGLTVPVLIGALLAASACCAAIVELRSRYAHETFYRFLDWNLFLAWVPLLFALGAYRAARRRLGPIVICLSVGWLLFFPNAPYMLTDFIHLQDSTSTPLWYDGLMLSAFAWTALLLGFFSLYLMHAVWRNVAGTAVGWIGVVLTLALGSLGVYIGRYIGFNSWDALLHPLRVAHVVNTRFDNPIHDPRRIGSLLLLTAFLTMAYALFYAFAGLRMEIERERVASR